jgi:nucleotide-binding universal stress UspA family protein
MAKTQRSNPTGLFRSILVPVDFSEHSATALKYAGALAAKSGGRLFTVHAIDPMLAAAAAVALRDRNYARSALDQLNRFVAKALRAGGHSDVVTRSAVESGDPAALIPAAARRFGCDLIVVGTHGLSGIEKALLGSTTERLLRRSPFPVLAVPPDTSASSGPTPGRRWPGTSILVPVDLTKRSVRDVRNAEAIARALGTGLLLVHVVPPIQPPPWFKADLSTHWTTQVTDARRQLDKFAASLDPGVATESRVVVGMPADEIAAVAAEERIGLVVMHRRKGPGWFGPRAGTIAASVLRHAVTPVLVLPDEALGPRTANRARARTA